MNNSQYPKCKGCYFTLNNILEEDFCVNVDLIYHNCPCQKCLIKTVCDTECKEYEKLDMQATRERERATFIKENRLG
jgi:hypothetical protein